MNTHFFNQDDDMAQYHKIQYAMQVQYMLILVVNIPHRIHDRYILRSIYGICR